MVDVPALQFHFDQNIQFYEADSRSAVAKIEWRDRNGMHFGATSTQKILPVGLAAHEKVQVALHSFPEGGSDQESK